MADGAVDHDTLISRFCEVTGTAPHEARQYLSVNRWDFSGAVAEYFASQDEDAAVASAPTNFEEDTSTPPPPSGPRTLGGAPVPASGPLAPSSSSDKGKAPKRFATLGDFGSGGASHSHSDDDDDDEDYVDDEDEKQDLYAGGEKSGIAVQNPNDFGNPGRAKSLAEKLVKKATEEARRGGPSSEERQTSRFTGTGMTLGSDETPSEAIPDPNTPVPRHASPLQRTLTFWRDGFSVGDGPLMRYDDPANERYLRDIRRGRAPLDLLGVDPGQETNVEVFKRMNEDYVASKPKNPFQGGGQRLGSPTPGPGTRTQASAAVPTATASSSAVPPTSMNVDESQPTISLQVRLGDGSRLVSRFNTTHTVGDVYSFVDRAIPASAARPWVLMTTFPSKQLRDNHVALGDLAEFRRGGVVVQKWE